MAVMVHTIYVFLSFRWSEWLNFLYNAKRWKILLSKHKYFDDFLSINLGQFVDGSQNGPAPEPWEINAAFKEIFKNETQHHEVPHTAFVKVCLQQAFILKC